MTRLTDEQIGLWRDAFRGEDETACVESVICEECLARGRERDEAENELNDALVREAELFDEAEAIRVARDEARADALDKGARLVALCSCSCVDDDGKRCLERGGKRLDWCWSCLNCYTLKSRFGRDPMEKTDEQPTDG